MSGAKERHALEALNLFKSIRKKFITLTANGFLKKTTNQTAARKYFCTDSILILSGIVFALVGRAT